MVSDRMRLIDVLFGHFATMPLKKWIDRRFFKLLSSKHLPTGTRRLADDALESTTERGLRCIAKASGDDVDGHSFVSEQLCGKTHSQFRGIAQGRHSDGGFKASREDRAGDMTLRSQLCNCPLTARLAVQRQYGTSKAWIAQCGEEARSVFTTAFNPAAHDHCCRDFRQASENACKANTAGADFTLHRIKNRQ